MATDPQNIEFGLIRAEAFYDAAGNLATVTWTPPSGNPQTQVARLVYTFPYTKFIFNAQDTVSAESQAAQYMNLVNSAVWRNYPPRTCLCLLINGGGSGTAYNNTYTIGYRRQTWDKYEVFRNVDGRIPPGIAGNIVTDGSVMSGNGWGRFIVFGQTDFNKAFPNIK